MCFSSKSKSTTSNKLDKPLQQKFDLNYAQGQSVADRPFEPYTDDRIAGFSPNQTAAAGMISDIAASKTGRGTLDTAISGLSSLMDFTAPTISSTYKPQPIDTGFLPPQLDTNFGLLQISAPGAPAPVTTSYTPSLLDAPLIGADFSPHLIGGGNSARELDPGAFAGLDLSPYLNPYADLVMDATLSDLDRARRLALNENNAAAAGTPGAFGGSRHGVADAETNRGFADAVARASAQLRAGGFDAASRLASDDLARKFAAASANQATDLALNSQNQAADIHNSGARDRADQLGFARDTANQNTRLQAGAANQSAGLAARGMNLDAENANARNVLDAERLRLDAERANVEATLQANGMNMDAQRYNEDTAYRAALQDFAVQVQNAQAAETTAGFQRDIAELLGGLSDQELNQELIRAGSLFDVGTAEQANEQAKRDAAFEEFLRRWTYPILQQQLGDQAVTQLPITGTVTNKQTRTPSGLEAFSSIMGAIRPK